MTKAEDHIYYLVIFIDFLHDMDSCTYAPRNRSIS